MLVTFTQEGEIHGDVTVDQRYHQMIDEVLLADELGFYAFGTSEQHFSPPRFTVSAPEVLYAGMALQTKQIKLRTMASVMLKWNHPILVAERLATLDILSKGRAEICTARSNNLYTLEVFGVDPSETAKQWDESMEVLVKALTEETLEHNGELWKIPPRQLVPRCVQSPHPAISVAASSAASHAKAAARGFGVIGFESYFGFDYMQECIDAYRNALGDGSDSMVPAPNRTVSVLSTSAFCAETKEEAVRVAHDAAMGYFRMILDLYGPLANHGTYEYLERMRNVINNADNFDFLLNETPSVLIGTPDHFVARIKELEERGVDEVVLRIDGLPSEEIKRSLELIGREVIPRVDSRGR